MAISLADLWRLAVEARLFAPDVQALAIEAIRVVTAAAAPITLQA